MSNTEEPKFDSLNPLATADGARKYYLYVKNNKQNDLLKLVQNEMRSQLESKKKEILDKIQIGKTSIIFGDLTLDGLYANMWNDLHLYSKITFTEGTWKNWTAKMLPGITQNGNQQIEFCISDCFED